MDDVDDVVESKAAASQQARKRTRLLLVVAVCVERSIHWNALYSPNCACVRCWPKFPFARSSLGSGDLQFMSERAGPCHPPRRRFSIISQSTRSIVQQHQWRESPEKEPFPPSHLPVLRIIMSFYWKFIYKLGAASEISRFIVPLFAQFVQRFSSPFASFISRPILLYVCVLSLLFVSGLWRVSRGLVG